MGISFPQNASQNRQNGQDGPTVPRGALRANLHSHGRIADMVDFNAYWDEAAVSQRIDGCFDKKL